MATSSGYAAAISRRAVCCLASRCALYPWPLHLHSALVFPSASGLALNPPPSLLLRVEILGPPLVFDLRALSMPLMPAYAQPQHVCEDHQGFDRGSRDRVIRKNALVKRLPPMTSSHAVPPTFFSTCRTPLMHNCLGGGPFIPSPHTSSEHRNFPRINDCRRPWPPSRSLPLLSGR